MFKPLSRRTFLRGTGVAMALPWMESMAPARSFAAAVGGLALPKKRMVCIRYNLSVHPDYFFPTEAGRNYGFSKYLEPLKDLRDKFTVFSGLSHPGQGSGGGHTAEPVYLTANPQSPAVAGFKNSISLVL